MLDIITWFPSIAFYLPTLLVLFFTYCIAFAYQYPSKSKPNTLPKSYPLIGSVLTIIKNRERQNQWLADIINSSPSSTIAVQVPLGPPRILTANPANFQHILKTRFRIYQKGESFRTAFYELFGDGLFLSDGKEWKLHRQLAVHEYNRSSYQELTMHVTGTEISNRLHPILSSAAANKAVLDLQEILRRLMFDIVCQTVLGCDLESLIPSLPKVEFADAFGRAIQLGTDRYMESVSVLPALWKVKRFLNVGTEKQLRNDIKVIHGYIGESIRKRREEMSNDNSRHNAVDFLSRLLSRRYSEEKFLSDTLTNLVMAGEEAVSSALTWFFWLISRNPIVEKEIVKEIRDLHSNKHNGGVKDMAYTHAALCESMRLYPPVPANTKVAMADDVWPDGTMVKKGQTVVYHIYAIGRSEEVWGSDCEEFRPERWLEIDAASGDWRFMARDPFTYPVFQAGPRNCVGTEIAMMQMKLVVSGVLNRFRLIPAVEGFEPFYISDLTSKMKDGFPVKVQERIENS